MDVSAFYGCAFDISVNYLCLLCILRMSLRFMDVFLDKCELFVLYVCILCVYCVFYKFDVCFMCGVGGSLYVWMSVCVV